MDMALIVEIIISIITSIGTVVGVLITNNKTMGLMQYQIKELSERVDKHNNLIDRMYRVEERLSIAEEKIKDIDK